MSLAATLRPANFSLNAPGAAFRGGALKDDSTRSFWQDTNYINLNRMLIRYSHLILLTPNPSSETEDITPLQQQVQSELWSPLPFYRTKWLHNIEGARNLLLQLERAAQALKGGRTRQNAQKDLTERRTTIRRLRNRIDEIGREVERTRGETMQTVAVPEASETLYDVLLQQRAQRKATDGEGDTMEPNEATAQEQDVGEDTSEQKQDQGSEARDSLLSTSSTIRRRDKQAVAAAETPSMGKSTGVSAHEKSMHGAAADQETLTTSLVSLAAQLKQQTRAFQFSLDQDKGLLNRALEGLDRNISGMEAASKNMQFLKRMSEGEGWLGRMKLYAIIFGMWVAAILLVFVGPKLRF